MFIVDCGVDLRLYLRLDDVIDRKSQRNARQRACPGRIAVRDRLRVELGAVCVRGSQDDDQVVFSVLLRDLLDALLTFQVKCPGRGSDKALGLYEERLGPCALDALCNGRTLYAVPLS